ncbi:MAG: hypothetical protein ACFFAS_15885 [Promethearchaeota archaeon]
MKLANNAFKGTREIKSFTKEEIIGLKRELARLKEEKAPQEAVNKFLEENVLDKELTDYYAHYLYHASEFITGYLKDDSHKPKSNIYPKHLIESMLAEINLIIKNLSNLSQNCRNAKRFLKDSSFLDELIKPILQIEEKGKELVQELDKIIIPASGISEDLISLWLEINRIKDNSVIIENLPETLKFWEEINEIKTYFDSFNKDLGKKKKKVAVQAIRFTEIVGFVNSHSKSLVGFYSDLIYVLYKKDLFREFEDEYINVHVRKEITQAIKELVVPIFTNLIKIELQDVIDETTEIDKQYPLGEDQQNISIDNLLDQKLSVFLPKLVSYYFTGLEKKYQDIINDVGEQSEFNNILENYDTKVSIFLSIIKGIIEKTSILEVLIIPYNIITDSLKKILSNLITDVERRKTEYEFYLKIIKKERLRDNINNFVSQKINLLNEYVSKYEDETSLLIREEFPQVKKMRQLLTQYKECIQQIKTEIYTKLNSVKKKDLDIHQIIKRWEDNYHKKKNQISFLLSLMINKIFKNFKDLLEEEETFFENIADITDQEESMELPLNFSLSHALADKMTDYELRDRMSEIKARITKNERTNELFKAELVKMEEIIETRVKIREGITDTNIKCTVCHQFIKFGKENIIKCPFCESAYHYLCVASWLAKHNACPTCQNVFLDPNSNMYKLDDEEYDLEEEFDIDL